MRNDRDDTHRHHPTGTTVTGSTALESGVVPLKELKDYTVAKGDPDVRGWEVLANDGRRIGKVDELLVDTGAMKVRYLDVDLDRDIRGAMSGESLAPEMKDDHVLIPIGSAQIHERDDRVVVDLLHTLVGSLPTYNHGPVSREYETDLRSRLDRDYRPDPARDRDFYESDLYNSDRFYGPRRTRR
jgi:sporulation protein YlmC with PRC-barrel domain